MEQKTDRLYPSVPLEKNIDLDKTPGKKQEITRC